VLRDLGSRNGTLVNGQLVVGDRELVHGDTVQIGPLVLEVQLDDVASSARVSLGDTALVNQDDTKTNQPDLAKTSEGPIPVHQEVESPSPH
jgi:pSer/pThr/pTyr-binding forkhead associated (FHA) protein